MIAWQLIAPGLEKSKGSLPAVFNSKGVNNPRVAFAERPWTMIEYFLEELGKLGSYQLILLVRAPIRVTAYLMKAKLDYIYILIAAVSVADYLL